MIGKRYTGNDLSDGSYAHLWKEWFANGLFDELADLPVPDGIDNGYIGLMGCSKTMDDFEYWIGAFFQPGSNVPPGYEYVDIPESIVGVCWIKGNRDSGELYGDTAHNMCVNKMRDNGFVRMREDFKGEDKVWRWFFERYNNPRFTEEDEDGEVILDYGICII
jgi:hypothetical protein